MGTHPLSDLPTAELEVLGVLLRQGPCTARQTREALEEHRPLTHSAVSTLLQRLQDRGLVRRSPGEGRTFLYRAAPRAQTTRRRLAQAVREHLYGGSAVDMVSALFEKTPSAEELERLEGLLAELRRQHEGKA